MKIKRFDSSNVMVGLPSKRQCILLYFFISRLIFNFYKISVWKHIKKIKKEKSHVLHLKMVAMAHLTCCTSQAGPSMFHLFSYIQLCLIIECTVAWNSSQGIRASSYISSCLLSHAMLILGSSQLNVTMLLRWSM